MNIRAKNITNYISSFGANDYGTADQGSTDETRRWNIESIRNGLSEVTQTAKGLMSATDKKRLDSPASVVVQVIDRGLIFVNGNNIIFKTGYFYVLCDQVEYKINVPSDTTFAMTNANILYLKADSFPSQTGIPEANIADCIAYGAERSINKAEDIPICWYNAAYGGISFATSFSNLANKLSSMVGALYFIHKNLISVRESSISFTNGIIYAVTKRGYFKITFQDLPQITLSSSQVLALDVTNSPAYVDGEIVLPQSALVVISDLSIDRHKHIPMYGYHSTGIYSCHTSLDSTLGIKKTMGDSNPWAIVLGSSNAGVNGIFLIGGNTIRFDSSSYVINPDIKGSRITFSGSKDFTLSNAQCLVINKITAALKTVDVTTEVSIVAESSYDPATQILLAYFYHGDFHSGILIPHLIRQKSNGRFHNPLMLKKGYAAHRGIFLNSLAAPENSLDSLRLASAYGFDYSEFDIGITSDNQFVVMHDATTDRTTDGTGAVSSMTLDELRQYNLLANNIAHQRVVPTLEEYLTACVYYNIKPIAEVSNNTLSNTQALNLLSIIQKTTGIENTIVASFLDANIVTLKNLCGNLTLAYNTSISDINTLTGKIKYFSKYGNIFLNMDADTFISIQNSLLPVLTDYNIPVSVWVVTPSNYLSIKGANIITTNNIPPVPNLRLNKVFELKSSPSFAGFSYSQTAFVANGIVNTNNVANSYVENAEYIPAKLGDAFYVRGDFEGLGTCYFIMYKNGVNQGYISQNLNIGIMNAFAFNVICDKDCDAVKVNFNGQNMKIKDIVISHYTI